MGMGITEVLYCDRTTNKPKTPTQQTLGLWHGHEGSEGYEGGDGRAMGNGELAVINLQILVAESGGGDFLA